MTIAKYSIADEQGVSYHLIGRAMAQHSCQVAAAPTGAETERQNLNEMARCGDCHGDTRAPGEPNYHNF